MRDMQRKALIDQGSTNGNASAYPAVGELDVVDDAIEMLDDDMEEDQGSADIEFVVPAKVKIRIDVDQLNWDDFLAFEKLSADAANPDSLEKILSICRRCIVNHDDPMKLPLSTFRPVMEAISKGIQGRSNRKN